MINLEFMKQAADKAGFTLTSENINKLDRYADLLVEWNSKINLTTIVEPDEIVIKHYIDSFLLLNHMKIENGTSLIDVGAGAGFPSLPCKILEDTISLTMLDSLNKRINFLNEVVSVLGIKADCIHGRAEELGHQTYLREQFDYACARAVAHLRELAEYCLPFVKVGGSFIALKGFEIEAEIAEANSAIHLLGGKVVEVKKYTLEDESKRAIVVIKKISQMPPKYPRNYGRMKKKPL